MNYLAQFKSPRLHDPDYLAWLRKQPCCICYAPAPNDAAHIKSAELKKDKPSSGTAKPDDKWAVPLCRSCHMAQHGRGNELAFWASKNRNPFELAEKFYAYFGGTGGEPKKQRRSFKRKPLDQRKKIPSRPFPNLARPFAKV